jgi:hypothetical protein
VKIEKDAELTNINELIADYLECPITGKPIFIDQVGQIDKV